MNTAHERGENTKDEWLTPRFILESLGTFDLDPCSPGRRAPWPTAKTMLALPEDGLSLPWHGRVWCNPPYGTQTGLWLKRMADHGNGIALIFARTDTAMFFESIFPRAHGLFFLKGRLRFCHVSGEPAESSAGAPSVLVAYGKENADILCEASGLSGWFVRMNPELIEGMMS